jgi:urease subunit alpha
MAIKLRYNIGTQQKNSNAKWENARPKYTPRPCGLKDHEDWGINAAVLDASLKTADATGTQVAIHSDSIN